MTTVLTSSLGPFFSAIAEEMDLYVPRENNGHYVYHKYRSPDTHPAEFNNIRAATPAKDFLFPSLELAATYPDPTDTATIEPFAVFGLKNCDLISMEVLDKVFLEKDFLDVLYEARRKKMFVVSSDCSDPGESCCCNLFDGQPFADRGFDLNLSSTDRGYIVQVGSSKGEAFLEKHSELFSPPDERLLAKRDENRKKTQARLEQINEDYELGSPIQEIVTAAQESDYFDTEAEICVECQACTRICPTCHCFYLYDEKREDYFSKMKMWDSCMRMAYAEVAGGENPRKILGERIRHRLLHKFSYFFDRYDTEMCVGCGRCIDADSHKMDIRTVLSDLTDQAKSKQTEETK